MTVQYQGVWTLQSAAQLQSTQRWVTDPLFENTTLLLQADDAANGAQNNTFLDSSSNAFAITRNGNTTQGSFTPFSLQPGAWGNFFGGSPTYLSVADNSAFIFGTGNFTVECWFYTSSSTVLYSKRLVDHYTFASSTDYGWNLTILRTGGPSLNFTGFNSGSVGISLSSNASVTPNAWNHFAVVRQGSVAALFFNGVRVAQQTGVTWNDVNTIPGGLAIGAQTGGPADTFFDGYLSNVRVVKGTAVYDPNNSTCVVPVGPLTAISGTSLLTCQSNRFVDNGTANSGSGFVITPNGTPSVQPFSPFAPQFQWTPSVIGGSGYFDGTGDWINVADSTAFTLGSGNFTVEFWVYSTTAGVRQFFAGQVNSAGANTATSFSIEKTSGNKLLGAIYSGVTQYPATSSGDIPLNAWTHIALVRDGNTLRQYINGVQDGTASVTGVTVNDSSNQLSIGRLGELASNNYFGYVSNFRFVNGTAVYTGAFTPPIAPVTTSGPASSYSSTTNVNTTFTATNTALLTNFTNAGIYDGTMKNNLETVGNAQISTAVVKYGSGSMYFDGTGDYLVGPASPNNNLNIGDFTLEFWIYRVNLTGDIDPIGCGNSSNTGYQVRIKGTTGFVQFLVVGGASLTTTTGITAATWQHIAIVRSGTTVRMYINGVDAGGSGTVGNSGTVTTELLVIGANRFDYSNTLNGYIDDLRITRGIARYTQNFIPPSVALPRQ